MKYTDKALHQVTIAISAKQREKAEMLAIKIQRNGLKKVRRITANSIYRVLINILPNVRTVDIEGIETEKDLQKVLIEYFKTKETRETGGVQ